MLHRWYLTYKLGRFLTHKCDLEQRLQLEVNDFFLMGLVSRKGGLDIERHSSTFFFFFLSLSLAAAALSGTGMKERKSKKDIDTFFFEKKKK